MDYLLPVLIVVALIGTALLVFVVIICVVRRRTLVRRKSSKHSHHYLAVRATAALIFSGQETKRAENQLPATVSNPSDIFIVVLRAVDFYGAQFEKKKYRVTSDTFNKKNAKSDAISSQSAVSDRYN